MISKRAHTLVEMMVVLSIFIFIFGAVISIMLASNNNWRTGQHIIYEQQDARKAMDNITRLLRQSNPSWDIGGTLYPVTITGGNRIDFYQPLFDANGNISTLSKVTYKLNPSDTTQLLRKIGTEDEVVVANNIDSVNFCGCPPGCAGVSTACPVVEVRITTRINTGFTLISKVMLRNINPPPASLQDTEVSEPAEGEF